METLAKSVPSLILPASDTTEGGPGRNILHHDVKYGQWRKIRIFRERLGRRWIDRANVQRHTYVIVSRRIRRVSPPPRKHEYSMNTATQIALVTGANKGLGLEIARQLGRLGYTILLGARDEARGAEAAKRLQAEGLQVHAIQIDMHNPETFTQAHDRIASEFGHLDCLVNNAGFAADWIYNATNVPIAMLRDTFDANFFGLVELTQILLPLIAKSPAGRIVNQSSVLGSLTLHCAPDGGLDDAKAVAYNSSKTALNAFTVHLAHALKDTPIKVNAAHPGSVKTDANPEGPMSVEEGARTAVRLATLPADGPTGGFFHGDQSLPW